MPQYKLTYFNLNALAEPIRWAFKISKVDFEDERIEFQDWAGLKASGRFPIGHIPILEIDGQVYTQSGAILKYVARKYGLITGDELLDLRVEQVYDTVNDAVEVFRNWFRERQNVELKETMLVNLKENLFPLVFNLIDSILKSSDGEFISGSKLTYGDLMLANWFKIWADFTEPGLREKYPRLATHEQAVLAIPEIKEWVEARPKVMF